MSEPRYLEEPRRPGIAVARAAMAQAKREDERRAQIVAQQRRKLMEPARQRVQP